MSRRLAVVVAHPDDDTLGVAGVAALHADDPGFRLALVHVTSGDRGMIADPSLATPETLGAVREEEDRRSWSALGREPDRHEFWRYPDGEVPAVPLEELVGRVATLLREERPDVVVTFGPDGITAHPDHIRVGQATTDAFHLVRGEGGEGLSRLLHVALPAAAIDRFNVELVRRGMDPIDPTQVFQPRGVPDDAIAVRVDCSPVWRRKKAALDEHRTQAPDMAFPDDLLEEVLSAEYFVQAWPERAPGEPVLGDPFEKLS
jgi:LmbE family N-acetylglucosaminyl deacetylase